MLFLELWNKKQIDAAPPAQIEADLNQKFNSVNSIVSSIRPRVDNIDNDVRELFNSSERNKTDNTSNKVALSNINTTITRLNAQLYSVECKADSAANGETVSSIQTTINTLNKQLFSIENKTKDAASNKDMQDLQQTINSLQGRINTLKDQAKLANTLANSATIKSEQATNNTLISANSLRNTEHKLRTIINAVEEADKRRSEALSGNIELRFDSMDDVEVSAAELNAAVAEAFTKELTVVLASKLPYGEEWMYPTHTWATLEPTITPGNTGCFDPTVVDADDVAGTPTFRSGYLRLTVIFDTDEGVTKVYNIGDTVTVKVKVDASATRPWAAAEITKTYTVIA